MKQLILILSLTLLTVMCCNGQPKSDYILEWDGTESSYFLYVWQGTDTTTCPFIQGADWKYNNVGNFFQDSVQALTTTLSLDNDGNYLKVALVAKNTEQIYSGLGVSNAYKKGIVPTPPALIRIHRL